MFVRLSKMAQQVRALAFKPDHLNLILRICMVKINSLTSYACCDMCMKEVHTAIHTHTHTNIKMNSINSYNKIHVVWKYLLYLHLFLEILLNATKTKKFLVQWQNFSNGLKIMVPYQLNRNHWLDSVDCKQTNKKEGNILRIQRELKERGWIWSKYIV